MTTCEIQVHSEMYGLGVRVGFYIQWFGIIVAYRLGGSATQDLRVLNALCVFATSVALLIQTAMNSLHAVEIYVVLLLVFGQFYFAIPLYLWRLITGCDPSWNLSRWPQAPSSPVFRFLTFLLFLVLLGYQMWFWTTGIRRLHTECGQYAFLFTKLPLENSGFAVVNIMFDLALLLGAVWALLLAAGLTKHKKRKRKRISKKVQTEALQQLQTLFDLGVAIIMVAAVELVVRWNNLEQSNNMSTAAQLIPTIVSAGLLTRIFFLWLAGGDEPDESNSSRLSSRPRSPPPIPFHYPQGRPPPAGGGGGGGGDRLADVQDDDIIVEEEEGSLRDMSTAALSLPDGDDNDPRPAGPHHPFPPQPPPPPGGRPPPPPMPAYVPGPMPGGMPPPPPPPPGPMPGGILGGGGRPPPRPV